MARQKYYAVKVGSVPGIYLSWAEAEPLVKGYPGAQYKSFSTKEEAESYLNAGTSADTTTINYPVPQGSKERKALAQILQCISNIYLRTLFKPKKLC